ncbi:uncharacterized protein LOC132902112 [Amyelois transitella]|uniref:uncharacterized protein LOC132902112 n=1 Tax=Amyelois transitella TaxID=680683 RepID=UPI00298FB030|nr:uncharacterized protein LOC132902112 [Amyelois transitella]
MAVSKVIIACVFIGILSKEVSNQPTKRSRGKVQKISIEYNLPKQLQLHDIFDIIIKVKNNLQILSISLMTEDNKTACTLIIKSDHLLYQYGQLKVKDVVENEGQPIAEISLSEFLQDSTIKVSFTVRKNEQQGETNTLEIGGQNGSIEPIEIHEDISMSDIRYLRIVGDEMRVAELKFLFGLQDEL